MRYDFGLNTDIFETNILNLAVVLRIVVTNIVDALRSLLEQRQQIILSLFIEVDQKVNSARQQLVEAREAVDTAKILTNDINIKATETVKKVNIEIQVRLDEEIRVLRTAFSQSIQLEVYQHSQAISQRVITNALTIAKNILTLEFRKDTNTWKQKELNKAYIRTLLKYGLIYNL